MTTTRREHWPHDPLVREPIAANLEGVAPPGQIDDALIDRIVESLRAASVEPALPGSAIPVGSTPAEVSVVPGVPSASSAASSAPTGTSGVPGSSPRTPAGAPGIPGGAPGLPVHPIPAEVAGLAAGVPGAPSGIPGNRSGGPGLPVADAGAIAELAGVSARTPGAPPIVPGSTAGTSRISTGDVGVPLEVPGMAAGIPEIPAIPLAPASDPGIPSGSLGTPGGVPSLATAVPRPPARFPTLPDTSRSADVAAGGAPTIPDVPNDLRAAAALPGVSAGAADAAALPDVTGTAPYLALSASALPTIDDLLPPIGELDRLVPRVVEEAPPLPATAAAGSPGYYFLPASPTSSEGTSPLLPHRTFDVRDIRKDFPILQERVHGKPLIWLDNAATTQKPRAVIERLVRYYEHEYSNVHRGAHTLAARSTDAYEGARAKVQRFLGAASPDEIVFVRGTTEGVNLVAHSWGRRHVERGDEIVLTTIEHHSNIVPWQFLAEAVGAKLRVVPVNDRGEVLLDDYEKLLTQRTRIVALTHVSNALGTVLPIREMVAAAHRYDARVLVDGAQAVSHFPVNVQALDADFYVLSGHKMFGPSGVGVVYGKKALLDGMPPWQGGGNMIQRVTFAKSTFADPPARFEAGTATLGPAVGLGAAVDYLERIGMANVASHEQELLAHATEALSRIPGLRIIGTAREKAGVVSFVTDSVDAEEMGGLLDQEGIAVRAGQHCAQPTMDRFGVPATVRPSFAVYNTHDEVAALARAVRKILQK